MDKGENWRASGLSKQDKNRLKKMMHYIRTFVASEDELHLLKKHTSPANTSSAEWNEWYTGIKGKCVSLSQRMFESFTQKEAELGIRVVKSRNGHVGAASERCNSMYTCCFRECRFRGCLKYYCVKNIREVISCNYTYVEFRGVRRGVSILQRINRTNERTAGAVREVPFEEGDCFQS